MSDELDPEHLEQRLELLSCAGLRVVVDVGGERIADIAIGEDGLGSPLRRDALHALYCAGKPVLALGVGRLVHEGEASWDDQLGWIIEEHLHPAIARTTLAELLTHAAGFSGDKAEEVTVLTPDARRELARTRPPRVERRGYGEFQSWALAGLAIEALTGLDYGAALDELVVEPLGLSGEILVRCPGDAAPQVAERVAINVDHRHRPPLPLLAERTGWFLTDWNPSFGVVASADGLSALYRRLLDPDGIPWGDVVGEQLTTRWTGYDRGMARECSYGLGFMTDLKGHDVSQHCGPTSFGHSGFGGMTLAFADPSYDLAVAAIFNGMTDGRTATQFRRPVVVDAIYRMVIET